LEYQIIPNERSKFGKEAIHELHDFSEKGLIAQAWISWQKDIIMFVHDFGRTKDPLFVGNFQRTTHAHVLVHFLRNVHVTVLTSLSKKANLPPILTDLSEKRTIGFYVGNFCGEKTHVLLLAVFSKQGHIC
jgi:hypothetical protein